MSTNVEPTANSEPTQRQPLKFSAYWTLLLMNAMLKTHKGYRKVRSGRYSKGNKQQKGWK